MTSGTNRTITSSGVLGKVDTKKKVFTVRKREIRSIKT